MVLNGQYSILKNFYAFLSRNFFQLVTLIPFFSCGPRGNLFARKHRVLSITKRLVIFPHQREWNIFSLTSVQTTNTFIFHFYIAAQFVKLMIFREYFGRKLFPLLSPTQFPQLSASQLSTTHFSKLSSLYIVCKVFKIFCLENEWYHNSNDFRPLNK
jgi:hypothetical protein